MKEWFESWFNSPYYHILYQERDEEEARSFLDNLISFLKPPARSRILDVACGKGRHSVYLNKKGFEVTGFDLSPENIEYDKQFENKTLSFHAHDMREVFRTNYFHYVFNLFSSFGYFDDDADNAKVISANAANLVVGGTLILDYMNSIKVKAILISDNQKESCGIHFRQRRKIISGKIIKTISFCDKGKDYSFEEHLQLYTLKDFEKLFSENNLAIKHVFGDYRLNPFDENTSDRLILIAEKNESEKVSR
jgi:SAM-dependent methyltransferase